MTAIVLSDGIAASLRAIEIAGCPDGLLLRSDDTSRGNPSDLTTSPLPHQQEAGKVRRVRGVSILYIWTKPSPLGEVRMGSSSGRPGSATRSTSLTTTPLPAPPQIPTAAAVGVFNGILSTIHTNKYLSGTLLYEVESTGMVPPAPPTVLPTDGAVDGEKPEAVDAKKAAPKHVAQKQLQKPATMAAEGRSPSPPLQPNGAEKEDSQGDGDGTEVSEKQQMACAIAEYVMDRVAHHRAQVLFLGAGNEQEGKQIVVGSVASEIRRRAQAQCVLYFIKPDGCKLRPTTTALHFVVVVPVTADPQSGGRPATEVPQQTAKAIETVVRYATRCLRPQRDDRVSVVLISVAQRVSVAVEMDTSAADGDAIVAAAVATPSHTGAERLTGVYSALVESFLDCDGNGAAVESHGHFTDGASEEVKTGDGSEAAEPNGNFTDTSRSPSLAAALPSPAPEASPTSRISVCYLKPTKQIPHPTMETGAPHILKYLSAYKADFILMSSALIPDGLQLALLGLNKPHCVIVPPKL